MATQLVASFLDGGLTIAYEVGATGTVTGVTVANNTTRTVVVSVAKHSTNATLASQTFAPGAQVTLAIQKNRQFSYASAPDWAVNVALA